MKTIAVINRRGGVGKTVTAHNLGAGLMKKGYRVLFIDLDSQTNLTFDLKGKETDLNIFNVLKDNCTIEESIQHTSEGCLVPATQGLSSADIELNKKLSRERILKKALKPIADKNMFDYVIIDTPPALNILTYNALVSSDYAIIPAQAEIHSIQGIVQLYETGIRPVQEDLNPGLVIKGILITRYNGRAILSSDMKTNLERLASQLDTQLFTTPIRECIAIKEAQASQTNIFDYAPKSHAAEDYQALINELIERV